ncbi:MAG: hypothetical protein JSU74_12610 [Candidatus Zixiibacteriota bacterium]|nr:MAG: hypothetical protein JSU74_12610 [candidate division Zixibacteria bacterium]
MLFRALITVSTVLLAAPFGVAAEDNCFSCHYDFEDEDGPSHMIAPHIHAQKGLGCVD